MELGLTEQNTIGLAKRMFRNIRDLAGFLIGVLPVYSLFLWLILANKSGR